MAELSELIAKLEGLSGPSREVDCLLWAHFDGRTLREDGYRVLARSSRPPHDECVLFVRSPEQGIICDRYHEPPIPAYTASLDAAVALVERKLPGWSWNVERFPKVRAQLAEPVITEFGPAIGIRSQVFDATTPAIALVLALLRALSSEQGNE